MIDYLHTSPQVFKEGNGSVSLKQPPNPGQNLGTFGEMQNVAKPYVGLSALSLVQ